MRLKVFNIERTRNVKLKKTKETREGVKKKKSYSEVKGLKVRKRNVCLYLSKNENSVSLHERPNNTF